MENPKNIIQFIEIETAGPYTTVADTAYYLMKSLVYFSLEQETEPVMKGNIYAVALVEEDNSLILKIHQREDLKTPIAELAVKSRQDLLKRFYPVQQEDHGTDPTLHRINLYESLLKELKSCA